MRTLELVIWGEASQKEYARYEFSFHSKELKKDLLSFCRENEIPMASSCYGDGVCHKCLFNKDQLGCQTTIAELFSQSARAIIKIGHL